MVLGGTEARILCARSCAVPVPIGSPTSAIFVMFISLIVEIWVFRYFCGVLERVTEACTSCNMVLAVNEVSAQKARGLG